MNISLKTGSIYKIDDTREILSPGLLFFEDQIRHNLDEMIRVAGSPERLCPHCKTHKTEEIIRIQMDAGIAHHKCATIAEAEMLATSGVQNVLLAYQPVGPNVERIVKLLDKFTGLRFATLVDNVMVLEQIAAALTGTTHEIELLLDLDSGMHRTGIEPGPDAIELYEAMATTPGIRSTGLHWYDGHNRQADLAERRVAVESGWSRFTKFRNQLMLSGLPISRVVAAGTGSFPILAESGEPDLQLSPGTVTLHDSQMTEVFPEMNFVPAAAILTRVVSNRRSGFLTLDAGHKSCAADQPAGKRFSWPDLPDAVEVNQTEEHVVIQTDRAEDFHVGDAVIAIPRHACPTSAVHKEAIIIRDGTVSGKWLIAGRDRYLTV